MHSIHEANDRCRRPANGLPTLSIASLVAILAWLVMSTPNVASAAPIGDAWTTSGSRCVDCCLDLLLTFHTNARRLDTGSPLVWSEPVTTTREVPVDFELHYEKSTGTATPLVLTGTLMPDGSVVRTSGNWPTSPSQIGCSTSTGVAASLGFAVVSSFRSMITHPDCGPSAFTNGTGRCFVDSDWEVAIARRLKFNTGVSEDVYCLKKVRSRINGSADFEFNQEDPPLPPEYACTLVDGYSLCATPWSDYTISTAPPNEVDCSSSNSIDICVYGEFLPLSMGSCN